MLRLMTSCSGITAAFVNDMRGRMRRRSFAVLRKSDAGFTKKDCRLRMRLCAPRGPFGLTQIKARHSFVRAAVFLQHRRAKKRRLGAGVFLDCRTLPVRVGRSRCQ